jgi:hypothetical protein
MGAFFPNLACNHSALSIECRGLSEPSEARSPANGLPSFPFTGPSEQTGSIDETGDGRQAQAALQEGSSVGFPEERLLLPFYLFGLTLWILSAQTMRVSWLAVAVVVVATLTAAAIWRRAVPHWLAFMMMALWGSLPFVWRSIDPKMGLALLGLLAGAIYTWCPTQENGQRVSVQQRLLRSVAALLAKYRSLPKFARRLELGISLRRCLSTGAALLVVGSLYGSYEYAYRLAQRNTRNMETEHDTGPIPHDTDLKLQSQLGADSGMPRHGPESETLPLRSHLSAEVQRERDLYIRGLHCLNDNDVACARLYFQLAAEKFRSGRSAIAMGDTFNPRRLKERRIYGGVQPDIVESRRWYERAHELSPSEASQRLQELKTFGKGS